jgi:plastocyanin
MCIRDSTLQGCLQNGGNGNGTVPENTVVIDNLAFNPSTLQVQPGTEVTWTNLDGVDHTVTSTDGNFTSSGILSNGENYTVTFNEAGEYPYFCTIHPEMTGRIVVTG